MPAGLNTTSSAPNPGFFVNPGQGSAPNSLNTTSGPNTSSLPNPANLAPGNNFVANTGAFSSSAFTNPAGCTGQTIQNANNFYTSPSLQFEEAEACKYKKVETLNESFKNFFYKTQGDIDIINESLKYGHSTLKMVDEHMAFVSEKCKKVLGETKKVLSLQKRVKVSLEIKQEFESKVGRFIKDFIRICDHGSIADQYHQINAPATFLCDFLELCGQRLQDIEEHIVSVEEIVKNECEVETIDMLMQIISLMQKKFKIVSAMTYDLHEKISKLHNNFSSQCKGFSNCIPYTGLPQMDYRTETKQIKENTPPGRMKSSNIRDVISGRSFFMSK